jgi:hypothetical protein
MSNDDLQVVAAAYRALRVAGQGDQEAYAAALEVYMARHPERPADKAGREVTELIIQAATTEGDWLYGREG